MGIVWSPCRNHHTYSTTHSRTHAHTHTHTRTRTHTQTRKPTQDVLVEVTELSRENEQLADVAYLLQQKIDTLAAGQGEQRGLRSFPNFNVELQRRIKTLEISLRDCRAELRKEHALRAREILACADLKAQLTTRSSELTLTREHLLQAKSELRGSRFQVAELVSENTRLRTRLREIEQRVQVAGFDSALPRTHAIVFKHRRTAGPSQLSPLGTG